MEALDALRSYGLPPPGPSSDIWPILLAHAPMHPIQVYAIAAANGSDIICIASSRYTLGTSLSFITEGDALMMGAVYLRRLAFLHVGRVEALKRMISTLPRLHAGCPSTPLAVAWNEGVAHVLLLPQPQNTPPSTLISTFEPLARQSECAVCKERLSTHVNDMCREWAAVSRAI